MEQNMTVSYCFFSTCHFIVHFFLRFAMDNNKLHSYLMTNSGKNTEHSEIKGEKQLDDSLEQIKNLMTLLEMNSSFQSDGQIHIGLNQMGGHSV